MKSQTFWYVTPYRLVNSWSFGGA